MMDEYIKRGEAINALKTDIMGGLNYESILKRIPSADVQPVKWIPVTERLPYAYKKVLTYERIRGIQVNFCNDDGEWWIGSKITHWMPLPKPPEDGET